MKNFLKQNIFIVLALTVLLVIIDLIFNLRTFTLMGIGVLLIVASLFLTHRVIRFILAITGIFLIMLSLLLVKSFWLLLAVVILFLILFRTDNGNLFFHLQDVLILPRTGDSNYYGIKLVEPQNTNQTMLHKQSLGNEHKHKIITYAWDDVNIVNFGGNQIIDFGNTILPGGQTTFVIRKLFGRTRIIVPSDIGIKLNVSSISGSVIFEAQRYELIGENFKWRSPAYKDAHRQANLIISVAFGDVEVIIL